MSRICMMSDVVCTGMFSSRLLRNEVRMRMKAVRTWNMTRSHMLQVKNNMWWSLLHTACEAMRYNDDLLLKLCWGCMTRYYDHGVCWGMLRHHEVSSGLVRCVGIWWGMLRCDELWGVMGMINASACWRIMRYAEVWFGVMECDGVWWSRWGMKYREVWGSVWEIMVDNEACKEMLAHYEL